MLLAREQLNHAVSCCNTIQSSVTLLKMVYSKSTLYNMVQSRLIFQADLCTPFKADGSTMEYRSNGKKSLAQSAAMLACPLTTAPHTLNKHSKVCAVT